MHPRLGVQVHLDENSIAARLEKPIERAVNGAKLLEAKPEEMRSWICARHERRAGTQPSCASRPAHCRIETGYRASMANYRRVIHGWAVPARGNINAQASERPSAHHGAPPAVNPSSKRLNEGRSLLTRPRWTVACDCLQGQYRATVRG